MGLFEIKTVHFYVLPDGTVTETPTVDAIAWIKVKDVLPYEELLAYQKEQFKYIDIADPTKPKIKPGYVDLDKFLLKLAIVDWSEDAEVNEENIGKLPGNVVTALVNELKKRYGLMVETNTVVGE